jgi:hypothetical protein
MAGLSSNTAPRIASFLALQCVLIGTLAAWGAARINQQSLDRDIPTLREEPLEILPTYNYEVVVTDEQLQRVMNKLRPRFDGEKTKINHTDHGLRFWTMGAGFDKPEFMSGDTMRTLLTDHREFAKVFGDTTPPLLMDDGDVPGVRVRVQEGNTSSSHVDHTLACLAEVGTPLSFPLITARRATTYRDMLEQSLSDFSLNQNEYEWSALTYALFLPPEKRFVTSEGQEITFDLLADRIMRESLDEGVCFAHHRMHALVMMLRVDETHDIITDATRIQVIDYLRGITQRLVKHQHMDGFWNSEWHSTAPAGSQPSETEGDRLSDRILSTGHALEWWALAPEELHPPRAVLAAAGQWMVRTIDELTPEKTQEFFTYLSHAGRSLALWRSQTPPAALKAQ